MEREIQSPRNYSLVINKIYNSSKRHTLLLSPSTTILIEKFYLPKILKKIKFKYFLFLFVLFIKFDNSIKVRNCLGIQPRA